MTTSIATIQRHDRGAVARARTLARPERRVSTARPAAWRQGAARGRAVIFELTAMVFVGIVLLPRDSAGTRSFRVAPIVAICYTRTPPAGRKRVDYEADTGRGRAIGL